MANHNIASATTIKGQSVNGDITTSPTVVLTNSGSSGKVFKINTMVITNIDGSSTANFTASVSISGGTAYNLFSTVDVAADTATVAIDKNSTFYLLEGGTISLVASGNSDLTYMISYEEIS